MQAKFAYLKLLALITIVLIIAVVWLTTRSSTGNMPDAPTPVSGDSKVIGPITIQVPKGWREESPKSPMRKMQFSLPRTPGDAEDAELVVFYFGQGQGGDVQANIARWISQFTQPDGTASARKAKIDTRKISGMQTTIVDVSGTYEAQSMAMPGMPASKAPAGKPNFRMLAAIVETPEGSYFFKLTGPEKTIQHWSASFQQFINSIKKT